MSKEKRMVDKYEVIACQRIEGEEIIVGEYKEAEPNERYLCCYVERNNIFERYNNAYVSDSYAEIFEIYGYRIADAAKSATQRIKNEVAFIGDDDKVITADKCNRFAYDDSLLDKVVVIDSEYFNPEYQLATHKLMLCTGGFGAYPNARGRTCFCTSLYDGHKVSVYRQDIIGTIDKDKLPNWAKPGYEKAIKKREDTERNER